MCGIAGIITSSRLTADRDTLAKMLERIHHRGPDADGIWNEENAWLGHKRLSIIDISPTGAQPMISHCGRYVISYNGEVYNFPEIRAQLESKGEILWNGTSDTEVLLELIARIGLKSALQRTNGMFAFALWDRKEKQLHLARDRFGEKPLYYAEHGGGLLFASELTAIEANGSFPNEIDPDVLSSYLSNGNVPAPLSIYKGVRKLPPGCYLKFSNGKCSAVESYWSLTKVAEHGKANPFTDEREMLESLEFAIEKSCRQKMVSDVPLGAFLSGGIDSSTVVALMQKQSSRPIKTFTIGFDIPKYNESEQARAVANHLGTDHTEQILTEKDAIEIAPRLGALYDEPFADSSAIPTYLVSRMTRSQVTVCLSGDGGDELFAGYTRYFVHPEMWRRIGKIPMRRAAGRLLRAIPPSILNYMLLPLKSLEARISSSKDSIGIKAHRLAERMDVASFEEYYRQMMMYVPDPDSFVRNSCSTHSVLPSAVARLDPKLDWMCLEDGMNYLPNDILTKVDRASMATSLECRVPLLDPEIAEIAWRIPASIKTKDGDGKWPLRQVLYKHVPKELFDRPKMGLGIPLREWLRGPLRDWACDLLSPDRVARQGLLNDAATSACLNNFISGQRPDPTKLWTLLMLQCWLEERGK